MTCSRNRLAAAFLGGLIAAALAAPGPEAALAQQATAAPQSILPAAPADTVPAAPAPEADVTTSTLTQGEQFRIGILDDSNGGFPASLWQGTSPATVTTLLPNLPLVKDSPALHDLGRRLLLTAALLAPSSDPAVQTISDADRALLAARLNVLASRGDLDGVIGLAARTGRDLGDDRLLDLKTDAFFLAEDYEDACLTANDRVHGKTDTAWLKALAFCRSLTGDRAGAALTVDLLQERESDAAVYYQLLAARLAETPGAPPLSLTSLQPPTPLLVSMALNLGVELPGDSIDGASPLVLAKLATTPALNIDRRMAAAWTVARLGGFDPAKTAGIFAAAPFSADERAAAALLAPTLDDAAAHALLFQGIVAADAGADRARLIQAVSKWAAEKGTLPMVAAMTADAVAVITPSDATLPAAVDIGRLLLLAGRPADAAPWYNALRDAANAGDSDATTALIDLWPLMIVGAGDEDAPWSPDILEVWWQGRTSLNEQTRQEQAVTLFTLLEAMGYTVPDTAWAYVSGAPAATGGASPSLAVWRGLTQAAADRRLGETVLDALIACGDGGPGTATPVVLASVVRALKDVGLEADARRIAMEALVAHGL